MSRPKPPTYRTTNWHDYNAALVRRGSLSIWFDPETQWLAAPTGRRGRQPVFADAAIQTCLTLKALFGGPAQRSATENQIIGSADGQRGDPGVRSNVGSPGTQVVDTGLVTRDIIFAPEGDGRDAQAAIPGA